MESMVRDLMAVGVNMVKSEMQEKIREQCIPLVEEQLLDLLLPGSGSKKDDLNGTVKNPVQVLGNIFGDGSPIQGSLIKIDMPKSDASVQQEEKKEDDVSPEEKERMASTREKFRQMLREGKLEDRTVEITVHKTPSFSMGMMGSGNPEDIEASLSGIQEMLGGGRNRKKTVTVREARNIIMAETLDRQVDNDKVADEAKSRVEQSGIIFIDEIDKIATHGGEGGRAEVSREGVQRDILPIVEGCDVNTKWGVINTTHILFIGAG